MSMDGNTKVEGDGETSSASRVVLVSARPMFRRTFGKLLGALRSDLTVHEEAPPERTSSERASSEVDGLTDDTGGDVLVILDAGDRTAAALAESVRAVAAGPDTARGVVVVLDETDDALTDAAMSAGARGVMIKAASPGVIAEWLDALLDGEIVRPAPSVPLGPETLSETLRSRLSARRQKLLRFQMGGTSVTETARALGMTPAKVVTEMRVVMDIVRGRAGDD